jgi:DNA-binding NarL/FixJ family response regulator
VPGQRHDVPASEDSIGIVVADDHPAVLDAVVRFLQSEEGLRIVGRSRNGDHALRLIEQQQPTVALLDIRMPGRSGVEIARQLNETGSSTGVILYTGNADRGLVLEALDIGVRGFLLKEAPLDDLARAIQLVARGETYVDPALSGAIAGGASERIPALTKREREILRMIADGMRNEQVARTLSISALTVRTHVKNAMVKLEADTRTQAVARALRESIIT